MKKILSAIALSLSMSVGTQAVAAPAMFSQEKIDAAVEKTIENKGLENFDLADKPKQGKAFDKKFATVAVFSYGAAVFDAGTTNRTMNACQAHYGLSDSDRYLCEQGVLPGLAIKKYGNTGHYAFATALTSGTLGLAYLMKKSKEPTLKKMWWTLPVTLSGIFIYSGVKNIQNYNNYQKK